MNKIISFAIIILSAIGFLTYYPVTDIVSANYTINPINFDSYNVGFSYNDTYIHTKKMGGPASNIFRVDTDAHYSGLKSLNINEIGASNGYINFTIGSNKIINFTCYLNLNSQYDGGVMQLIFFNKTHGSYNVPIIKIWCQDSYSYNEIDYYSNGASNQMTTNYNVGWKKFYFNIDSEDGAVTYGWGTYKSSGKFAQTPSHVGLGYSIDTMYIDATWQFGQSGQSFIDDIQFTLTGSYNPNDVGNETTSGCSSPYNTDNWIGTGFTSSDSEWVWNNYVHFIPEVEINGTFSGFELLVQNLQFINDNDLNNYILYYNDWCLNEPCGFVNNPNGIVLQWDLTPYDFSTTGNERAIWTLQHDYSGTGVSWCFPTKQSITGIWNGYSDWERFYYEPTWTYDGTLTGSYRNEYLCYKIFMETIEPTEPEPSYSNSLTVYGQGVNQSDGIQWVYTTNTVWFAVTINNTDLDYSLHLYKSGVEVGEESFYPVSIEKTKETYGYVPMTTGYYNVTLKKGSTYILHDNFYVKSDWVNKVYDIWTVPPKTYQDAPYYVNVYIDDSASYSSYEIGMFYYANSEVSFIDSSVFQTTVGTLNNYNWSFLFTTNTINKDAHFWRLFGLSGDDWLPLGELHKHIVDTGGGSGGGGGGGSFNPWISVSDNTLYLGQSVHISGYHSFSLNCWVFVDSTRKWDVSQNTNIDITTSFNKKGNYVISLREYIDGEYIPICDSVLISVNENNGGGGGGNGNGTGGIDLSLKPPVSYIVGAIILVIMLMIPVLATKNSNVDGMVTGFASLTMGVIAMVIDILLGYFPVWVIAVIITMCSFIILIMWLRNRSN